MTALDEHVAPAFACSTEIEGKVDRRDVVILVPTGTYRLDYRIRPGAQP